MSGPAIVQYWVEDLPRLVDGTLKCPRCGDIRWTTAIKPYGVEMACFNCPTFVGIKVP